jgi:hypothetical protein
MRRIRTRREKAGPFFLGVEYTSDDEEEYEKQIVGWAVWLLPNLGHSSSRTTPRTMRVSPRTLPTTAYGKGS